jgi:hypothetical protein
VDPKELFHDLFYIHQPRTWQVPAVPELESFAPLGGSGGIYQYDLCTGYGEIEKVSIVYRGPICDECLKFAVPFLTAVSRATTAAFEAHPEIAELIKADFCALGERSFFVFALRCHPPEPTSAVFKELMRCSARHVGKFEV